MLIDRHSLLFFFILQKTRVLRCHIPLVEIELQN